MEEHIFIDELTNILLKTGALDPEAAKGLDEAFAQSSHENFDYFLLNEGLVDKEDLLHALSIIYRVPSIDVDGIFFETFLLQKFPKDVLMRNRIIPYEQDENMLIVVAADPADDTLLDVIGEYVSYDIRFFVGIATDIIDAIESYYEKSLTQIPDEDKTIRIQRLDNLPYRKDERDLSSFVKAKIDDFVEHETDDERREIEDRAHNLKKR
jgi:hypothetical protein